MRNGVSRSHWVDVDVDCEHEHRWVHGSDSRCHPMVLRLFLSSPKSPSHGQEFEGRRLHKSDHPRPNAHMRLYGDLLSNGVSSSSLIFALLMSKLGFLWPSLLFFFSLQLLYNAATDWDSISGIRFNCWYGKHRHLCALFWLWTLREAPGLSLCLSSFSSMSAYFVFCSILYFALLILDFGTRKSVRWGITLLFIISLYKTLATFFYIMLELFVWNKKNVVEVGTITLMPIVQQLTLNLDALWGTLL